MNNMNSDRVITTGKRKKSIARIVINNKSSSAITINNKSIDNYFDREFHRLLVRQPLIITNLLRLNIRCNVIGGGLTGQAGAIKHAISKALCLIDSNLRIPLRKSGLLTRDSRQVERKKFGRPKARKKFQFSKR